MPRERSGCSRQASARNSPAPDSSSQDGLPATWSSGKGRKTRNSAESVFYNVDLEALLRRNSRRGKEAKRAAKETRDTESGSNVGDESSQDGPASDNPASTKAEQALLNGRVEGEEAPSKSSPEGGSEKEGKSGIRSVNSGAGGASRSHVCPGGTGQCADPGSKLCDIIGAAEDSAVSDQPIKACDIKSDTCAGEKPSHLTPVSDNCALSGKNTTNVGLNSSCSCDTHSRSATTKGNPSIKQESTTTTTANRIDCPGTIKKESCGDDSGFVSFQTTPHNCGDRVSPDKDLNGDKKSSCVAQSNAMAIIRESENGVAERWAGVKAEGGDASVAMEKKACGSENGSCLKKEDCDSPKAVGAACKEGGDASSTLPGTHPQPPFNALMDHDAYSEEEMVSFFFFSSPCAYVTAL